MNYYQDIRLIGDAEVPLSFVRNKTYTKLHKAIFDLGATDIGVSFPKAGRLLGDTIRLHSNQQRLASLNDLAWLGGLSGYCKVSDILQVPNDQIKGYQTMSRLRQNMTSKKLQQRITYQKNNGTLKDDNAIQAYRKQYLAKMMKTGLDAPYLEITSASTGSLYRIYLKLGEIQTQPTEGAFNRFGLSKVATVPVF